MGDKVDRLKGLKRAEKFIGDLTGNSQKSGIMGKKNDCSFGEFGFSYSEETNILKARVFIIELDIPDPTEEEKENVKKFIKALFDPKIGGMFDHGGGKFFVDNEKEMLFLTRDFKINDITYKKFKKDMDILINTGATWSMRWVSKVTGIVHGWEPMPEKPVKRNSQ